MKIIRRIQKRLDCYSCVYDPAGFGRYTFYEDEPYGDTCVSVPKSREFCDCWRGRIARRIDPIAAPLKSFYRYPRGSTRYLWRRLRYRVTRFFGDTTEKEIPF